MANVELPAAVGDQGRTASGVPITDELIDRLAAKAEDGHDVEQMLLRREGRPAIVPCPKPPSLRAESQSPRQQTRVRPPSLPYCSLIPRVGFWVLVPHLRRGGEVVGERRVGAHSESSPRNRLSGYRLIGPAREKPGPSRAYHDVVSVWKRSLACDAAGFLSCVVIAKPPDFYVVTVAEDRPGFLAHPGDHGDSRPTQATRGQRALVGVLQHAERRGGTARGLVR